MKVIEIKIDLDDDDLDMAMVDSFDSAPPVVDPVSVIVDPHWDAFVRNLPAQPPPPPPPVAMDMTEWNAMLHRLRTRPPPSPETPPPSPPRAVPVVAIPVVTRAVPVAAIPVVARAVPVPLVTDMGPAPRAPKKPKGVVRRDYPDWTMTTPKDDFEAFVTKALKKKDVDAAAFLVAARKAARKKIDDDSAIATVTLARLKHAQEEKERAKYMDETKNDSFDIMGTSDDDDDSDAAIQRIRIALETRLEEERKIGVRARKKKAAEWMKVYDDSIGFDPAVPISAARYAELKARMSTTAAEASAMNQFELNVKKEKLVTARRNARLAADAIAATVAAAAVPVAAVPVVVRAPLVLSAARIAVIAAGGHCSSAEGAVVSALRDVVAVSGVRAPVSGDADDDWGIGDGGGGGDWSPDSQATLPYVSPVAAAPVAAPVAAARGGRGGRGGRGAAARGGRGAAARGGRGAAAPPVGGAAGGGGPPPVGGAAGGGDPDADEDDEGDEGDEGDDDEDGIDDLDRDGRRDRWRRRRLDARDNVDVLLNNTDIHGLVQYKDVMAAYKMDRTRVRQCDFDVNTLASKRCNARTKRGVGPRCKLYTTIYPKTCWLHTQMYTGLKIIRSKLTDAKIGVQTLKRLRAFDATSDEANRPLGGFTGTRAAADEVGNPDVLVVNGLVARTTQDSIVRLVQRCLPGDRAAGQCSDNNAMYIRNPGRGPRRVLVTRRNIEEGEEILLTRPDAAGNVSDVDEEAVDDADWPATGPLGRPIRPRVATIVRPPTGTHLNEDRRLAAIDARIQLGYAIDDATAASARVRAAARVARRVARRAAARGGRGGRGGGRGSGAAAAAPRARAPPGARDGPRLPPLFNG